jgi:hypothetical protein
MLSETVVVRAVLAQSVPKPYVFVGFLNGRVPATVSVRGGPLGCIYIKTYRFNLDTLRVPSRSPTPTSKTNDSRRPFDRIWGSGAAISGRFVGVRGVRAGLTNTYLQHVEAASAWGPGKQI